MAETSKIERIVWAELVHSAYWEQYLSQYVSHKYDKRNLYNVTLLILSTVGASSFSAWKLIPDGEKWIPTITLGLIAATQLVAICQKNVVIDDDTARKLRELRIKYLSYLNQIERLYLDIRDKGLSAEEIKDKFFAIRETVYPIEELKDSLNIKKLKKPNERGQYEMEIRLSRKYGTLITPRKHHGLLSRRILKLLEYTKKLI